MNSTEQSTAPAIAEPQDAIKILQDVSQVYESLKGIRRRAAKLAREEGHTYQELSDALGINRSGAYNLIHRDTAA